MLFRLFSYWTVALAALSLVACGSGGGGGDPVLPPLPVAPAINTQPVGLSVSAGQTASFSVVATGSSPDYQWRRDGVNIAGANQSTYSFTATEADNNAVFTVRVSNLAGAVTSNGATLRVDSLVAITAQPNDFGAVVGQVATFSVVATGSNLQYQWRRNGTDIASATQSSYSITSVLGDDGAQFSVHISNSAGSATSRTVGLRVTPLFVSVSIATQPRSLTVRAGEDAGFSVGLAGTGPFTWEWLKNGVPTGLGVTNTFATTPSFVFTPALLTDNGTVISLRITDSIGTTITTEGATLSVQP